MEINFRNSMNPSTAKDNRWIYSEVEGPLHRRTGSVGIPSLPGGEVVIFNSIDIPFSVNVSSIGLVDGGLGGQGWGVGVTEIGLYSSDSRGRPSKKLVDVVGLTESEGRWKLWDFKKTSLSPGRYHVGLYTLTSMSGTGYVGSTNGAFSPHLPMDLTSISPSLGNGLVETTTPAYWYDAEAAGLETIVEENKFNLPDTIDNNFLNLSPIADIKGSGTRIWYPPFFALRLEP